MIHIKKMFTEEVTSQTCRDDIGNRTGPVLYTSMCNEAQQHKFTFVGVANKYFGDTM